MDLSGLLLGLETALQPTNILVCLIGVTLGTAVGVLPGIGPTATVALLLPVTFTFDPIAALIMLAGIYYGAQYGGSTTAILLNLPGESSSAVTAIDGYQMARKGRAGAALATAALGSFFAGTVATIVVALFAPPMATAALKFGPAEYFALVVLGLIASIALASGSTVKALAMIILGLLLGTIGQDLTTGVPRFTFGIPELDGGLNFVSLAVGVFGIAEILRNLESRGTAKIITRKVKGLWLSRKEFREIRNPVLRGTAMGSLLGVLPGGGHILASFTAYSLEKRISKRPQDFGKGAIEGVAAPESANNAAAQTAFIPLLTLGLPAHPVMALLVGAFIMQGIVPGPNVISDEPALFWGLIASFWVGNLLLVMLNLPLIGLWVRMLSVPYEVLFPAIIAFATLGCYSLELNAWDVFIIAGAGVIGYALLRWGCEPAPLLLGFVLGPLLEENLRRALIISRGDASVFFTRPISGALLAVAAIALLVAVVPMVRKKRQEVFVDED
ncbi:tripartite tricarboxylate transporter permease [Knoellia sp. S7-12]|uniref:tripartite tricarboxylate transporter permease n=1 Tax=Knoellia sp. S7-12 TaxID=3126698 RepID=UPI003368EBB2